MSTVPDPYHLSLFNLVLPTAKRLTYHNWEIYQISRLIFRWHHSTQHYLLDKHRLCLITNKKHEIIEGHITGITYDGIEFQSNYTGYNPHYTTLHLSDYIALSPN